VTVIVDTGPIVVAASVKDQHHDACVAALHDFMSHR
jgi:predicted nucleic acid-binding protein